MLNVNSNGTEYFTGEATASHYGQEKLTAAAMKDVLAGTVKYTGGYMYTGVHVVVDGVDLGAARCHRVRSYDNSGKETTLVWAEKVLATTKTSGKLSIVTDLSDGIRDVCWSWDEETQMWSEGVHEYWSRSIAA